MVKKNVILFISIVSFGMLVCGCNSSDIKKNKAALDDIALTTEGIIGEEVLTHYMPDEEKGIIYEYYQNDKGNWIVEGKEYKYRLVLTGTMPKAEGNTTYVVLSNREDISFNDLTNDLTSNDSNQQLSEEDAFLVEIR